MSKVLSRQFVRVLVLASLLISFFLTLIGAAQRLPAPGPPGAPDSAFQPTHEDWTTPALAGSHLQPVQPLVFASDMGRYTLDLLQVQWRPGDPIDLYVLRPKGVKKPPVILYLNGYPTDTDIFKRPEYQELVTKNGAAAVGFVSALTGHRYHDRPMKEWFISNLQESLATSAHDVQMVLNYLETRGDLDMDRVGMFSQGSGATIAILASAVDPRIKVLEALDPWGDWPTWLADTTLMPENERPDYVKPEFLKSVASLEPVDQLPKIKAQKFRLDQELFDSVTPIVAKVKLRLAVPPGSSVVLFKNMDEFKAAFEDGKNLEWIQHELQSLPAAAEAKTGAPLQK